MTEDQDAKPQVYRDARRWPTMVLRSDGDKRTLIIGEGEHVITISHPKQLLKLARLARRSLSGASAPGDLADAVAHMRSGATLLERLATVWPKGPLAGEMATLVAQLRADADHLGPLSAGDD